MSDISGKFASYERALTGKPSGRGVTALWTIVFAFCSAGFTWHATGEWSAGLAVLFALWAVAGIIETSST